MNAHNFDPFETFFVIDSEHLEEVRTRLYGFVLQDGAFHTRADELDGLDLAGGGLTSISR